MIRAAGQIGGGRPRLLPMVIVGNGIIGGMEEYVLSLVRHFRERGQRALVAAPFIGEFTAALLEQGHPARDMYIFDMSDHINVGALAQLSTFIRARKVSLVHTHLQPADTLGAAAAAHAGIPALSTLHGLYRCKEELLLRDLYGIEFVAVSEAGRASAVANGLAPEEVRKIPNGVDPLRFDPASFDRAALRHALGIHPEEVLVTCVSRLSNEKYPEGFLQVAEIAAASDPRLAFALVGTGPLESKLRQLLSRSRVGNRVLMLGARRDIPEILAASDIAALSSRTESLPFSVLEAMAMELPVVSHDVGGVGEAIEDGSEGFLVPFGRPKRYASKIAALAADPGLRRRMGQAARRKVLEEFDFGRTAEALLELYAEIVERREAGRDSIRELALGGNGRSRNGDSRRVPPARAAKQAQPDAASAALDASVVDCHLHLSGGESREQVLETLDAAGVECACLIAPFLDRLTWIPAHGKALRRANEELLELVAGVPHRLWGLVALDPREEDAPLLVERYATVEGVCGVKLVPHGWSPDEQAALELYEACEAAGLSILFHSGVFISGRCSDTCRPALYEAVRRFPRLKVVLAHLGWPWTDEAIAVAYMDVLKGAPPQILLDLSPGTPPIYRREALLKAFEVVGPTALVFGSDRFLPTAAEAIAERVAEDVGLLRSFGASAEDLLRIFEGNASQLFSPAARRTASATAGSAASLAKPMRVEATVGVEPAR